MALKDIDTFEKNNKNISVNVFGYEQKVYPLRISRYCERETIIDLLLIANDTTNHYCLVTNLQGLLRRQAGNQHIHYCRRCLNGFRLQDSLVKHKVYCDNHEALRPELPKPGTMLSFKNYNRSMRVPFVVYADFESIIKSIDTCQPDPRTSYTKPYQKHIPSRSVTTSSVLMMTFTAKNLCRSPLRVKMTVSHRSLLTCLRRT